MSVSDAEKSRTPVFILRDPDNVCFLADFELYFEITYTSKSNNESKTITLHAPLEELTIDGHSMCGDSSTSLIITWRPDGFLLDETWNIEFKFNKTHTYTGLTDIPSGYYHLYEVSVGYYLKESLVPNVDAPGMFYVGSDEQVFKLELNQHFACQANKSITTHQIVGTGSTSTITVKLARSRFQAFMNSTETEMSKEVSQCAEDTSTDNTIPIAVGIALAICIIIALIGFFVMNHRSRKQQREQQQQMDE